MSAKKLFSLLVVLLLCVFFSASCDCGDDDDDDNDNGSPNDDDAADDDTSDDDENDDDDDATDDDATDDDESPTALNCIPPLDYDGDGDAELLLSVWLTDINTQRLYLAEPGTFERGDMLLEYDVTGGGIEFQVADFDGNDVWDILAIVESGASGSALGWYDVYMNGDFSDPAHTFGPYEDTHMSAKLVDTDGNNLPEMMIEIANDDKGTSLPAVYQLIDADNDFSTIATINTPESAPEASIHFLPQKQVGQIWPVAGNVTGEANAHQLLAYAIYSEDTDYFLRLYVFNAANGTLVNESDPYYLGDLVSSSNIYASDVDGDGYTETVLALTEQITDPSSHTAHTYVLGGANFTNEWTGGETDDAYGTAVLKGDYNLDGVLDPIFGISPASGGDKTHQALNGPAGYTELFYFEDTNADPKSLLTQIGRGYLDFGFDYRGQGTEIFLTERSMQGANATGQLRALKVSDGSTSGVLQEFDLGETGSLGGTVIDLGGDGVLDLIVRYTERFQSGGDWVEYVFFEAMTAPDFMEILHEQMEDGYSYFYYTTLDVTGDNAPDLLVLRQNQSNFHEDYLLYPCDSTGCDEPVVIDYEADEQFYFIGPML